MGKRPMGKSNIFPKRCGRSTPTFGPGHTPGAQHIQPNLISFKLDFFFITKIVNLRALGLRIDHNHSYMRHLCLETKNYTLISKMGHLAICKYSSFFPIFWPKFLFFPYFSGLNIPIFPFF